VGLWCYRWLSLGGRLTLAKYVLESLPVYWLSLFKLPKAIFQGLRRRVTSFIWSGNGSDNKIHLARWDLLTKPKTYGGWGLRDLELFGRGLRMKSCWRALHSANLWSRVLIDKYLKGLAVLEWIKSDAITPGNISPIWHGFLDIIHEIRKHLAWQIGTGSVVHVGIDNFIGGD